MNLTGALYTVLAANTNVTDLLAIYTDKDGASFPAIFSADPVPEDSTLPLVVLSGHITDRAIDTKCEAASREIDFDIRCYADRTGSVVQINALSEALRLALHRVEIPIAGFDLSDTEILGPIVLDEDDNYGRVLTTRVQYIAPDVP